MEKKITMPENFSELTNEEMSFTEGGAVRLYVSAAGVAVARRIGAAAFGRSIVGLAGLSLNTAIGQRLFNLVASSHRSIISTAAPKVRTYNVAVNRTLTF